jgi:hypothetical protein
VNRAAARWLATIPFLAISSAAGLVEAWLRISSPGLARAVSVLAFFVSLMAGNAIYRRLHGERTAEKSWFPFQVIFFIALIAAAAMFWQASFRSPHGGWDAWTIWNLRARMLYRAGLGAASFPGELKWSHPDYPLFLPSVIVHFWTLLGHESPWVPATLAFCWTFGGILALRAFVSQLSGTTAGTTAAFMLLGTSSYLHVGLDQLADVPVSFLVLSAIAALLLADRSRLVPLMWRLAGLSAGLVAWTKNEGLPVALMLLLLSISLARDRNDWRLAKAFLTGLLFPLILLALFKFVLAPANDVMAGIAKESSLTLFAQSSRWWTILSSYERHVWSFGSHIMALVLVYCALIWPDRRRDIPEIWSRIVVAMIGSFAVYFGIYLLTPYPLVWHVESSLSRLIIQWWPTMLLLVLWRFPISAARLPVEPK